MSNVLSVSQNSRPELLPFPNAHGTPAEGADGNSFSTCLERIIALNETYSKDAVSPETNSDTLSVEGFEVGETAEALLTIENEDGEVETFMAMMSIVSSNEIVNKLDIPLETEPYPVLIIQIVDSDLDSALPQTYLPTVPKNIIQLFGDSVAQLSPDSVGIVSDQVVVSESADLLPLVPENSVDNALAPVVVEESKVRITEGLVSHTLSFDGEQVQVLVSGLKEGEVPVGLIKVDAIDTSHIISPVPEIAPHVTEVIQPVMPELSFEESKAYVLAESSKDLMPSQLISLDKAPLPIDVVNLAEDTPSQPSVISDKTIATQQLPVDEFNSSSIPQIPTAETNGGIQQIAKDEKSNNNTRTADVVEAETTEFQNITMAVTEGTNAEFEDSNAQAFQHKSILSKEKSALSIQNLEGTEPDNAQGIMLSAKGADSSVLDSEAAFKNVLSARNASTVNGTELPVVGKIVSHAEFMIKNGQSSAFIRLDPPNLGKVRLEIVTDDTKVSVKISVDSGEVMEIVKNGLGELKESFAQSGLEVESFDVQVGHNGDTGPQSRDDLFGNGKNSTKKVGSGMDDIKRVNSLETGLPIDRITLGSQYYDVWI